VGAASAGNFTHVQLYFGDSSRGNNSAKPACAGSRQSPQGDWALLAGAIFNRQQKVLHIG
jgi:hypothetical protein